MTTRKLPYTGIMTLLMAVAIGGTSRIHAQDIDDDGWQVVVAPYLWALSLDGKAGVGALKGDVDVPFSDTLSDLNMALMMIIDARKGRFGLYSNIMYSRVQSEQGIDNSRLRTTNDSAMVSVGGYFRALEHRYGESAGGKPLYLIIEPEIGVRWTHMELELKLKGASDTQRESRDTGWFDPYVGARLKLDLNERWNLGLQGNVGGFGVGSDFTWGAHALLGYRFKLLGRDSTLRFGYRALAQDYDSGSGNRRFQWDVTQHGPIIGIATVY